MAERPVPNFDEMGDMADEAFVGRDPQMEHFLRESRRAEKRGGSKLYSRAIVTALTAAAVIAGCSVVNKGGSEAKVADEITAENFQRGQTELINHLHADRVPEEVIEEAVSLYNDPEFKSFIKENNASRPQDFVEFLVEKGYLDSNDPLVEESTPDPNVEQFYDDFQEEQPPKQMT